MFAFLLIAVSLHAQKATLEFYTTTEGLSNNRIWSVARDDRGFIWLSTDALNRFDGQQFLNYNTRPEPIFKRFAGSHTIHALGSNVYYWEGRALVESNTVTGERRELQLDSVLSQNAILNTGRVYKISGGELLLFFMHMDKESFDVIRYSLNGFTRIGTISGAYVIPHFQAPEAYVSREGYLMYLDSSGEQVVEIDSDGKIIRNIPLPAVHGIFIAAGTRHETILLQNNRIYYLGPGDTEFNQHPASFMLASIGAGKISRVAELDNGDLWVSGEERQLYLYEWRSREIHSFHDQLLELIPYRQELWDITTDPSGVLWVNTTTGLLKIKPRRNWFYTYFTGQQIQCDGRCSFRGITEDEDGNIYSSYYSNMFMIDPVDGSTSGPVAAEPFTPFDLIYRNGGIITNQGLFVDPETGESTNPYQSNVNSSDLGTFTLDNSGSLWWCYDNEIFYLDDSDRTDIQWVKALQVNMSVNDITYDAARRALWVAGHGKLQQYSNSGGRLEIVRDISFDPTLIIRKLYAGPAGYIWMATESGLVRYFPENDARMEYTTREGLPSNLVVTILPEGDSCLWLGTHNGLSRFSIEGESFINFHLEEGLANNEFNRRSAFMSRDGRMYFGGVGGLTAFYPEEVMQSYYNEPRPGRLVLASLSKTDIKNDSTLVSVFASGDTVDVYPSNKTFRFEFCLTDYYNADNLQYSYQMEGYDNVWSAPSHDNSASFNYIPAGTYTFRVRAQTARGQWHDGQLGITVVVHAPWYASWWAYILYATGVLLIGLAIFYVLRKRWELKSHIKLKQAETDKLKELDSFKSKLYTNLTHEFRTPLTVILGMARRIQESDKEDIDDAAQLIESNGQNLLQLVNQLLDLSKLENNAVKLQLQHKDIIPYIQFITQSFQSYANSQNVSLRFIPRVGNLETDFDPIRLRQAMVNLISNALKFTRPGGDIKVSLDYVDTPHLMAISVEDNGVGIPQEDIPYIFDRFYQANGNTRNTSVGTGIGLAHTRELIKLMGGEITVASSPNRGSTFTITLPVAHTMQGMPVTDDTAQPDSKIVASPVAAETDDVDYESSGSSLPRLLIIEDNADVVYYLKTCVEHLYEVRVAYNGRVGIEMAQREIPDLIISDIMMPEKDGYEVCDTLKNDIRTSHIPIVLLTAKVDNDSKISGLKKGADAYLPKPFDQEELIVMLENMIEMRKRWVRWFTHVAESPEDIPENEDLSEMEREFVTKIHAIVEENYADEDFALPQLCQKIGMSRSQLFRKMKALMDITPSHYIRRFRLEKARKLLAAGDLNVSQVAWQVGFKHVSHFSKSFQEEYGVTPSATHK